ncbi:hypothetical protein GTP44_23465 [Duganella sp. FT50W]|uniref:Circularly permuted type 2 ATP-grasp protein n=1 Tax=Duganella lactea TaxID=2692173 RepID=A0A6L8MS46_9BURK|nr:hypothetical protein [Duganella lactea]MYM84893.1 hypothetical protein [Duganella lactea]
MSVLPRADAGAYLSERHQELMVLLEQRPDLRGITLDTQDKAVAACVRGYQYRVSAWPIIVSPARIAAFEAFLRRYPALCYKAMQLWLTHDVDAFCNYLNVSPLVHGIVRDARPDWGQMLNRHDVVLTCGVLRLIEVNAGCTIGGWQLGWMAPQFRAILQQAPETAQWALSGRNVMDQMFLSVCQSIVRVRPGRPGNLLFYLSEADAVSERMLAQHYRQTYEKVRPAVIDSGDIFFFSDFSAIDFGLDGSVHYAGNEIDAVLLGIPEEHTETTNASVLLRLVAAHLAGQIVMPDSPLYTIVGNKTLMAMLHEPEVQEMLCDEERKLIELHVPYTVRLAPRRLRWRGQNWELAALLQQRQKEFVLKKSHSRQGRDVFVGRYTDEARWSGLVEELMNEPDWLAQEFCEADVGLGVDDAGQLVNCAFIWGLFDTGHAYGGAFVRGMPIQQTDGVINSAKGAIEFQVLETAARKNKLQF